MSGVRPVQGLIGLVLGLALALGTVATGGAHAAPTATPTATPSVTASPTPGASATPRSTVTPTRSASPVPSATSTPTAAATSAAPAPRPAASPLATGTAIQQRYASLGGAAGPLGQPVGGEFCGLRDGGCGQAYQRGSIYWSPAAGAHPVWGMLLDAYRGVGYERSRLGYPTGAEVCGLRDGGCVQVFQGGLAYWSRATGSHVVLGAILGAYAAAGHERQALGYPLDNEVCGLRDGGCVQRFQGGLIYYSAATGAHVVLGMIREGYASAAHERSPLGYPTGSEFCGLRDDGCAQRFQGGLVYWSAGSGAHPVFGAIVGSYASQGWERSHLGYPIGKEFCGLRDGGCGQKFQYGSTYYSPGSGAHPVIGAILEAYARQGWEQGALRYPVGREGGVVNGAITQGFQGGQLVYHTATGMVDYGQVAVPGLVPGNYPDADAYPCGGSWCKNGRSMSARGFAYRNCTDFAAFRRGMVWSQINGGGDGNAIGWRQGWIQRGRQVSSVPRVGAVAWWGASRGGGYGHVAIVIGVNPDGSAKVEHYNFDVRGGYSITESIRADAYLY